MIEIKAQQVRELRLKTGAPMMNCKKALLESRGDMDSAVDWLRTKGIQIADKKSGRDANQGLVGVHVRRNDDGSLFGGIAEVNCETDFVAKNEVFQKFVTDVAMRVSMSANVSTDEISELVAKVGENIKLGASDVLSGGSIMAAYVHNKINDNLGTIGVLVAIDGTPSDDLAIVCRDIAMHIAASNPRSIDESSLDQEWMKHERQIFIEQARESGKSDAIIEKIVDGRMKKIIRENTLLQQPFVKNPDRTVAEILFENDATVLKFIRIKIGE